MHFAYFFVYLRQGQSVLAFGAALGRSLDRLNRDRLGDTALRYADLAKLRRIARALSLGRLAHRTGALAVLVLTDGHRKQPLIQRVAMNAFFFVFCFKIRLSLNKFKS